MQPSGTPALTLVHEKDCPFHTTLCFLFVKKNFKTFKFSRYSIFLQFEYKTRKYHYLFLLLKYQYLFRNL